MPKDIQSEEEFADLVKSGQLTIVDFYAPWCGACKTFMPKYEELEKRYGNVQFLKANVDELEELAGEMDVNGLPYICLVKGGKKVKGIGMVAEKTVIEALEEFGGEGGSAPAAAAATPASGPQWPAKVKVPVLENIDFFQIEDPKSKNVLTFIADGDKIAYKVNDEPRPSFRVVHSDGDTRLLFKDINKGATLPDHNLHINLACFLALIKKIGGEAVDFPSEVAAKP